MRIKRSAILIMMFFISFSAFSSVDFSSSISDSERAFLTPLFDEAVGGRKDAEISVSSLERNDDFIRLTFSIEGEERVISASNEAELGTFLVNALSLEKHLYMDEPNIFYLTDDIVASRTEYSKGEIIESYDESGKVRGLLEVTDSMDGINIYSPIYENDLRAGLSLRKGPTFSLSARAFSPLSRIAFGFAVDLAYLPLFPYFNLLASFLVNYDGIVSYHGGLGAEVRLPLKSIINTRFTLIEDGSISASAIFYMGYDGSFAVDSEFMVFYEHHATSRFFWRLGYEGGTISVGSLMLSCGVLL